jgi:hypothetical protein
VEYLLTISITVNALLIALLLSNFQRWLAKKSVQWFLERIKKLRDRLFFIESEYRNLLTSNDETVKELLEYKSFHRKNSDLVKLNTKEVANG